MKGLTTRQRVNRKILRLSLSTGIAAAFLTAVVYVVSAYPAAHRWKIANLRALAEINCEGDNCDTTRFVADAESGGSDYVIDIRTRYFITAPTPSAESPGRFPPLDYSDVSFIAKFRRPASYSTPDGEVWRLYCEEVDIDGKSFEIFVGHQEKAPSKIETLSSQIPEVDVSLKRDANQIRTGLQNQRAPLLAGRTMLTADGYAVVEASTGRVAMWGLWLPEFSPQSARLPAPGWQFYIYDGDLYILRTDVNERILAASFIQVGSLVWIAACCATAFFIGSIAAHLLGKRFLRAYFATRTTRVPTLEDALQSGEGQSVEFKRGLSDAESRVGSVEDEVLKSVAAFANTNDGVIFIGVDDAGRVKGLDLDFAGKDRMERKIRQLVRNRIKPLPPFQLSFEDQRGLLVATIVVARGEEPAYLMGGVIYVRYGSSDVQAQPEDLKRLLTQYAF